MIDDREYLSLDLYLSEETEKAYGFYENNEPTDNLIWIPKSQIKCITKFAAEQPFGLRFCRVIATEWIARQKNLI